MHFSSIRQKLLIISLALCSLAAYGQRPRWSSHSYALTGSPSKVVVVDVNGDGSRDLVIAIPSVPQVAVLFGNGNGTFQSPKYSPYDGADIAIADFTGDHKVDLATPERLYTGSGDGYFHYSSLLPKSGTRVVAADFKKDGDPDLAVFDCPLCPADPTANSGNIDLW